MNRSVALGIYYAIWAFYVPAMVAFSNVSVAAGVWFIVFWGILLTALVYAIRCPRCGKSVFNHAPQSSKGFSFHVFAPQRQCSRCGNDLQQRLAIFKRRK